MVLAVIAALVVAVFQYWGTSQVGRTAQDGSVIQTKWGPLGAADRDLLAKVRQAGLWEMPTSQQAQQQGSSARVREIGGLISGEHAELDNAVRNVAGQLGVVLPNQPSEQQQGWMAEIGSQSGSDFDRVYVQRLRAAHGKVLPAIAEVRAGSRNDLVRGFAEMANVFVTRHMQYLESTGLVDFSALPEPPAPESAPPAGQAPAPAAAPSPAAQAASADHHGGAAATAPSGQQQDVNQVANATSVGGANVMIAALVYIAALLAIVGLLALLGTAGLRSRRAAVAAHPRRAAPAPRARRDRPRHAAHRW